MPFFSNPAVISAGINLVGGLLGGESAADAARYSADASTRAAERAAEEARFTPAGVTVNDGRFSKTPIYTYDSSKKLTGVTAELTPEMKASQDRLLALTGRGLTQAEQAGQQYAPLTGAATGLFNLGERYLAETPEQVAQKYMTSQYDLLDPSRQRQLANIRNQNFQTGRGGLSVGSTSLRPSGAEGLRGTNPELEAYYNSLAQQDAQLAAGAQEAGQRQVAFGTGLFGAGSNLLNQYQTGQVGALSPFSTGLNLASTIEQFALDPVRLGAELGGRSATAGARAGDFLTQGARNAAGYNYQANSYNPFSDALLGAGSNTKLMGLLGRGGGSPYSYSTNPSDYGSYGSSAGYSDPFRYVAPF